MDILSNGRVGWGWARATGPTNSRASAATSSAAATSQEEAIDLIFERLHKQRCGTQGQYFSGTEGEFEICPSQQQPHPPLYMAGATDRSLGYRGRNGFGLMLSTLPRRRYAGGADRALQAEPA